MSDAEHVTDNRKPGWFWMHNIVFDYYGPRLRPSALAVYMCLTRHANERGESFPTKRTIAAEIGCGETAVNEAIKLLVNEKLIRFEHRVSDRGDMSSNTYTLLEPPLLHGSAFNTGSSLNVGGSCGEPGVIRQATGVVRVATGVVRVANHPPAAARVRPGGKPQQPELYTSEEILNYYVPTGYENLVEH